MTEERLAEGHDMQWRRDVLGAFVPLLNRFEDTCRQERDTYAWDRAELLAFVIEQARQLAELRSAAALDAVRAERGAREVTGEFDDAERCAACGGSFEPMQLRHYFGPPEGWVVKQRLGPIHSQCQRWSPAHEDALAKVLGASSQPPPTTRPTAAGPKDRIHQLRTDA